MFNYRKNVFMNICYTLTIMAFLILSPAIVAFAGDINSNEAGVISAASSTFEYEGKTYRAGSSYINSLTVYLSDDDVDLTADQAQRAINEMYNSIAEGVENGYLYEININGDEVVATTEESDDSDADDKDKSKENDKVTVDKSQPKDDDVDVWNAMSNQTEAKSQLKNRPDKTEADASVKLDEDHIVVTTKDNEVVELNKNEQLVPTKVLYVMDVIAAVVLGITLLCVVVLLFNKCMVFVMPKSRRARKGHTKRRKIRRYTRNVLTITTAASFVSLFIMIGIYISLFNKDKIMQNMQMSGYFRYAYSEYVSEFANSELTDADNTIVNYEDYVFTIKQNSMKILDGETDIRIPDSNVSPYISNIKKSYIKLFAVAGVIFIINSVLGIIFMIFMDQRRERGVKNIAVAELISSVIVVCITIYMAIAKPYTNLYIVPDYLYLFIMQCIKWSVKVMTSISAFTVVLGMFLVGVFKSMNSNSDV